MTWQMNLPKRDLKMRFRTVAALILSVAMLFTACGSKAENNQASSKAADSKSVTRETAESTPLFSEIVINDTDSAYQSAGTKYVRSYVEVDGSEISAGTDTNYVIKVNLAYQCVTVYTLDSAGNETPLKAFACSTARGAHITPEGDYYTDEWYTWCYMVDSTYGQYAYRLVIGDETDYMFHSVPYLTQSKDDLEWGDYDKLGQTASMGCIRLCVADARWICANVGPNVHVIVYTDESSPGPLGKPEAFFVPWDCYPVSGWDPTDPDPDNPWHSYTFTLSAPANIQIAASSEPLDITEYLTVNDEYGSSLARFATYECDGETYGFSYTVNDQETISTYPSYQQSELVNYAYNGMDVSKPGTYNIRIRLSIGPLTAYRQATVIVK